MTIEVLSELEKVLQTKCPKVALFDLGTYYTVYTPSRSWEGKVDEEILVESLVLKCQFVVSLDENQNKCWKIKDINDVYYKEFIG